ncbi:MAG: serine acetyltransferase [Muribaculaceae bacterium]|nr:serine acetyltransferase [Muribaculaceae bacterium]
MANNLVNILNHKFKLKLESGIKEILSKVVSRLSDLNQEGVSYTSQCPHGLPSLNNIKETIHLLWQVIFPELFSDEGFRITKPEYRIGFCCEKLYELLENEIAICLTCGQEPESIFPQQDLEASKKAGEIIAYLPELRRILYTDIRAIMRKDPAAGNEIEIILCYPAVKAMLHHRLAHLLFEMKIPYLPRIISELSHSQTGIDIHPGAKIGDYFAIDHGTGVVIGETCVIGENVTIYQGVTLGAKSFSYDDEGLPMNIARHPIIEDNVTIYSNASVLGRITIGHDSIIGGNVWITKDVKPHSRVVQGGPRESVE